MSSPRRLVTLDLKSVSVLGKTAVVCYSRIARFNVCYVSYSAHDILFHHVCNVIYYLADVIFYTGHVFYYIGGVLNISALFQLPLLTPPPLLLQPANR